MARFLPGIDVLLTRHHAWLRGRKIGLLSHLPAVNRRGVNAAQLLYGAIGNKLTVLFGPEHGFFGLDTAGQFVRTRRHPILGIPVHSLYGAHRRPTAAMLRNLDTLIIDLRDLGARCYTYVTTLRYALEAAAAAGKEVIVADCPIPLPCIVDGPMLQPEFASFVGDIPAPLHYGMTPGETALWLKRVLSLALNLKVARMADYQRESGRNADWPPWIPPSPGIRSWETGYCYLATVFAEALPHIDNARGTNLAFQVFGAPWIKSRITCCRLNACGLPGVDFQTHPYRAASSETVMDGIRIVVQNPRIFQPVLTSVAILSELQKLYGSAQVWAQKTTRADFFDKLYGTDAVRRDIQASHHPNNMFQQWRRDQHKFRLARADHLLYLPPRRQAR